MMNILKQTIAVAALILTLTACEYDNYDAPSVVFSGQLYDIEGDKFQFDGAKSLFAFFQSGYGKVDIGTSMNVLDDGSYRQLLFADNDYKLTVSNNAALPFDIIEFPHSATGQGYDSISYHVERKIEADFTVKPFYKIRNLKAKVEGSNIVATFTVSRMRTDAPALSRAYLYLGTSIHVNSANKCVKFTSIKASDETNRELTATIPISYYRNKSYGMVNNYRTYAFLRIALQVKGYNDCYLFSETIRIDGLNDLDATTNQ